MPCVLLQYVDTLRVGEIRYAIGGSTMPNVGHYTFEEEPFCGYPETVTLTNLPTFLTHNEDSSDFTMQESSDLSLIGEYIVNIKSEIRWP